MFQSLIIKGDKDLYENFQISRFIAKGNNTVYESINKLTRQVQCVKEIKLGDRNAENIFQREVKLLEKTREFPHCNVIQYKGSYVISDERNKFHSFKTGYIQMEKGITSLDNIIEEKIKMKGWFTEDEIITFMKSMLEAHSHLQNISIAHRDIKPQNIIVVALDPLQFKVCDVGVGTATGDENTKTRTLMGTLNYLSPELLFAFKENKFAFNYNPYKSDVYSLGLVFLYFCSLCKPNYKERIESDVRYIQRAMEIIKDKYNNIAGLVKVLNIMLKQSENDRIDFIELQNYISKNRLLRINNDFYRSVSSKFQVEVANEDEEIPVQIQSLQDLKKIQELLNHVVEVKSIEIRLNNLNKDVAEMNQIAARIGKIQNLQVRNLLVELTLNEIEASSAKILAEGLEACSSMQKLSINLWNNKMKVQGTNVLLKSLSKLVNLKSLELSLSSNYVDDDIDIGCLETLTKLEKLSIDLGVNRLNNQFFNFLLEPIQKLSELKSLTLNLESNRFISSQPLKQLPMKLSQLKKLEFLELNLAGMSIRNQGLFHIAALVNSLSLKVFNLLIWNSQIKDKAFVEFAKDFSPKDLKKFKLIIWGNSLTQKSIEVFAEHLGKLTSLQSLQLNFSNNQLEDQGIRILNKSLASLDALIQLKLSFDNTKCSGVGCRYIGRLYSGLKNLKETSLSLKGNRIGLEGFEYLITGLKECQKILKISLILEQCLITDPGLAMLTGKISKLSLLQELSLNLCACNLTESPLGFLQSCKNLKHLKEGVFDFRKNPISQALSKQILFQNQNVKVFDIKLDDQES